MLRVPLIGSSTQNDDPKIDFIDKSKINKWKNGSVSDAKFIYHKNFLKR